MITFYCVLAWCVEHGCLFENAFASDVFYMVISGPGCSKLTTSLVNETLKFQMLISQICQYCLLKK